MSERLKHFEGQRLYRALRILFRTRKFGFQWTNQNTSYFDGKDIHVKYDMNRPDLRPFTEAENRLLRQATAYHEVGHVLYDYLPYYIEWLEEHRAKSKEDWQTGGKYPISWLQFFGNMGLDGREEYLLRENFPHTKEYLSFKNYEWKLPLEQNKLQINPLFDFRFLFARLCMDMTDHFDVLPEVRELVDSISDKIRSMWHQPSTIACLDVIKDILDDVWPTLTKWFEEHDEEPSDNADEYSEDMTKNSSWADSSEEANQNSQEVLQVIFPNEQEEVENGSNQSSNGEASSSNDETSNEDEANSSASMQNEQQEENERTSEPSYKVILQKAERELQQDQQQVDDEEFEATVQQAVVTYGNKSEPLQASITLMPGKVFSRPDIFNDYAKEQQRLIKRIRSNYESLLEPSPHEIQRFRKSGRLMTSHVWRATKCENNYIYQKVNPENPQGNVLVNFMADISGSTNYEMENGKAVYEEIIESLVVNVEAAAKANVGTKVFAFTTDYKTTAVFRLKPHAYRFTDVEKGAIGGIKPLSGNRDCVALKFLLDETIKASEEIRIAMMISDGAPNFYEGENEQVISDMVKQAERKGIFVLCLFVGEDHYGLETAKRMYGQRVLHVKNGLAREMQKQISKIIKVKRG